MIPAECHSAILSLLWTRHAEDVADREVFVTEGSRLGTMRLDFLSIVHSWAKPNVTGYEVKVTRQDFLRDHKWTAYLPMCNSFVFVTAAGVATLGEIPAEAGWQELSANGKMLITRKKAPRRPMDPATEAMLYKHLLMRKAKLGIPPREYWRDWLTQKRADRELGQRVSKEIRHTVRERIEKTQDENRRLEIENKSLQQVRDGMIALGLDPARVIHGGSWWVERELRKIAEAKNAGPVVAAAEKLGKDAQEILSALSAFIEAAGKLRATVEAKSSTEAA
jgi:hypothetical protein